MKILQIITVIIVVASQCFGSTEIEQPEEPEQVGPMACTCVARCCTSPFEPRRASPVFHMPNVQNIACCGCVFCPSFFIGQQALPAIFPRPVIEIEPLETGAGET